MKYYTHLRIMEKCKFSGAEAHLHREFFASTAKPASASGDLELSQIAKRRNNYLKLVGSP